MDITENREILDGLDRRLALGEIDLGTYNQLKAKFSEQSSTSKDSSSTIVDAMPKKARAIKCPGCMAPLPASTETSQTVVCEYCGGTFVIQAAIDEMERIKSDIRKWLANIVGDVGINTTTDEASRRFIFNEQLLPSLKMEADRATEIHNLLRFEPLFTFPLLNHISSSPFHTAVQSTLDSNKPVDKIKTVIARAQSPEVGIFAIGDKEKAELYKLEIQCQEAIFLSNIRHQLLSYTPDGIQKAKSNIQGLKSIYNRLDQFKSAIDPSLKNFFSALLARLNAVDEAITILGTLLNSPEGIMTEHVSRNLESAAAKLEQAISQTESAGREPREQIPAVEGTRIDAQTVNLLAFCVKLFAQVGGDSGESFNQFLESLGEIVDYARGPNADLQWLFSFISYLAIHMGHEVGESTAIAIYDFSWVKQKIQGSKHSSFLGGKESVAAKKQILLPFWVAELNFSQQKGVVFKKGQSASSLLFLEAARNNGTCFAIPIADPLSKQCYNATTSSKGVGQSTPAIVPVINANIALSQMKSFISRTKGYAGARVKLLNMIYLPSIVARYNTGKKDRIEVLLRSASIRVSSFALKKVRLGTKELLLMQ